MTTTLYLRYGRTYPLHLLGDDDLAVCGALRRGGDGVNLLAVAPRPLGDWCTCAACRAGVDASHSANEQPPETGSLP